MNRPPLPPFTDETAAQKARLAEDAWNSRDPARVALAYTEDSLWRNRDQFLQGREAIVELLMAVRFAYESRTQDGRWTRSHGNELWEFDERGLMRRREAATTDVRIEEHQRLFHWPLGPRPDDHSGLTELDLRFRQ
jgi:uncharacterized protein